MSAPRKHRFEDKIRQLFKREPSPAQNTATTTPSNPTPIVHPDRATQIPSASNKPTSSDSGTSDALVIYTRNEPGQRIYDAAISALEEEDQVTIRAIVAHENIDGIKGAQDAVLDQQKKCEEKKWTMSVRGHTLGLGAVAGSLSQLLGKIQPGINFVSQVAGVVQPGVDLAASIDPLHIGLPVALMKAILGVVVFFQDQMERLLSGVKTATYMLKQLSLYFEYFKQVDSPAAAKNLEDVLAGSYTIVLEYLALGHRALAKRGPKQAWELLWSKDKVNEFENSCTAAGVKLETAASHCHRDGAQTGLRRAKEQIDMTLEEMKKLDIIGATIQALDVKVDLQRLKPASGAAYNFVDTNKEGTIFDYCLEGTRQKLIEEITSWCHQSYQTVFWVCGMAGTGKSTLIRTVARQIEAEGLLAASFFFRQDIADQKDGALFVQSIVSQLLKKYPILRPHVAAALEADLTLPGGPMCNQFAKLIEEPLSKASLHRLVLIIDALDECDKKHAKIMLVQLALLADKLNLRVVITSRPEPALRTAFDEIRPDSIKLEEVQVNVENDIRLFFETCFENLVKKDARKQAPRLMGWPEEGTIDKLVQLTKPLFIFAATLFRYVEERKPRERLAAVLREGQSTSLTGIQRVYLPILRQIYIDTDDEANAEFKLVVGTIVLLQDPLSLNALSELLDKFAGDIEEAVEPLHSVLRIPTDPDVPIRLLHKSFKDFLLDTEHDFKIDVRSIHRALQESCLKVMDNNLHKDICHVSAPGFKRRDFDNVSNHVTSGLGYACLHWISHIEERSIQDGGRVHQFLQRHFLHWLEALSWLGRLSSAAAYIRQLRSRVKVDEGLEISAFLDDTLRFVLMNRHVIDLAPLQLYHSALIFTPGNSIVRKTFHHETSTIFSLLPKVVSKWSAERQKLEGHTDSVWSLALCNNVLASGSDDNTVRLWDSTTGEALGEFEGPGINVKALALSPNWIATASAQGKVAVRHRSTGDISFELELSQDYEPPAMAFTPGLLALANTEVISFLDPVTGKEVGKLKGHDDRVYALAVVGDLLASASRDNTVRLWNLATGQAIHRLEGHEGQVNAVAFSREFLASASDDKTVRLWNIENGEEVRTLTGHDHGVHAVAFSPNGQLVSTCRLDVIVWNIDTGIQVRRLGVHGRWVNDIAFSADGLLITASDDNTIRFWDLTVDEQKQKSVWESAYIRVMALSQDESLLAVGSIGYDVFLWNPVTGEPLKRLQGHKGSISALAFSKDVHTLASGSHDGTVKVWDTTSQAVWTVTACRDRRSFDDDQSKEFWVDVVAFSQDGRLLASGSFTTIRVWRIGTREQTHHFELESSATGSLVFSHDDRKLTLGAKWPGRIMLWDLETGENVQAWVRSRSTIRGDAVVFSADDSRLASVSEDELIIRIYDVATGEELQSIEITRPVARISFADNDAYLETENSRFALHSGPVGRDSQPEARSRLSIAKEWIQYEGKDLIWLPYEYRESYGSKCSISSARMAAIGHKSGDVSFFVLAGTVA